MSARSGVRHPFVSAVREGLAAQYPALTAEDNLASYRYGTNPPPDAQNLAWRQIIEQALPAFAGASELLADDESRSVLAECLLYNALGWRKIKRRRNTPAYQAFAATLPERSERFPIVQARIRPLRHKFIHLHALPEVDLKLATTDGFFINVLFNSQYTLVRPDVTVKIEPGDVVLDCGGGWGDTAVLFAHQVGPEGRVVSFEFVPSNFDVFQQNLAHNPRVADRVQVVQHPVSARDGERVPYADTGTSSRIGQAGKPGDTFAETRTIDRVVRELALPKVDFIKMDIEGAEPAALRGAVETIRRFRPKLAISAYHRADDLIVLPRLIRDIVPEYRFWLDHHTIHGEETVLYGAVSG